MTKLLQQNLMWLEENGGVDSESFTHAHSNEICTEAVVDDSRSYDPYLIAYHVETNTFTYKDPWIESDQSYLESYDNCCNDNEINSNVETSELPIAHASFHIPNGDAIAVVNGTEPTKIPPAPEVIIEHEPKVSFPHDNSNIVKRFRCRLNLSLTSCSPFSPHTARGRRKLRLWKIM